MKKITLLGTLLVSILGFAQTAHNLDWQQGISGNDASLTIEVGDMVVWTITNTSPHTITSLDGSQETFDSGTLSGIGETFSYTFTEVGENNYQCNFHAGNMFGVITVEENMEPETISIPDPNFEQRLIDLGIDTNGLNGNIFVTDAEGVTALFLSNSNISSLEGLEAFENLQNLSASDNNISSIDVSENIFLQSINLSSNIISVLDVTQNTVLTDLSLKINNLSTLDLSQNTALDYLNLESNNFENIDLSANTNLTFIDLQQNKITNFDASPFTQLEHLQLQNMQEGFKLSSINTTGLANLAFLNISLSNVEAIDVTTNISLETLSLVSSPLITAIDVSNNQQLSLLNVDLCNLTELDLSNNSNLELLSLIGIPNLESLNIQNGNNSNLILLEATNNPSLPCIQVDEDILGNIPANWAKDDTAEYSADCEAFLAVEDKTAETAISIYPNPVTDVLNIELIYNSEISSIQIFDITGKLVLSQVGSTPQMDVSSINAGVYFVKISSEDVVSVKKMIKL